MPKQSKKIIMSKSPKHNITHHISPLKDVFKKKKTEQFSVNMASAELEGNGTYTILYFDKNELDYFHSIEKEVAMELQEKERANSQDYNFFSKALKYLFR